MERHRHSTVRIRCGMNHLQYDTDMGYGYVCGCMLIRDQTRHPECTRKRQAATESAVTQ